MIDALRDRGRLHEKANDALDQNLAEDESVEVIISGPSNQAIIGTPRRAFVYKKGFMAGATLGSELTSWDYRNLVGVQMHTGMLPVPWCFKRRDSRGPRRMAGNTDIETPTRRPTPSPSTAHGNRRLKASLGCAS